MRIAYIDHKYDGNIASIKLAMCLQKRGFKVNVAQTLEEFERKNDLKDFSVLLFHPGIDQQYLIPQVRARFPKLPMAIFTNLSDDYDDCEEGEIHFFDKNRVDGIVEFIKQHEGV